MKFQKETQKLLRNVFLDDLQKKKKLFENLRKNKQWINGIPEKFLKQS